MLQSRGENQKLRTSGQVGYITPAVFGVPNPSERATKSALAFKIRSPAQVGR